MRIHVSIGWYYIDLFKERMSSGTIEWEEPFPNIEAFILPNNLLDIVFEYIICCSKMTFRDEFVKVFMKACRGVYIKEEEYDPFPELVSLISYMKEGMIVKNILNLCDDPILWHLMISHGSFYSEHERLACKLDVDIDNRTSMCQLLIEEEYKKREAYRGMEKILPNPAKWRWVRGGWRVQG